MIRKNDLMYKLFGKTLGKKCKDCIHLKGGINEYRKCKVYGVSKSEATDWAQGWTACGLYNEVWEYEKHVPIMKLTRGNKQEEPQIEGQISMFE